MNYPSRTRRALALIVAACLALVAAPVSSSAEGGEFFYASIQRGFSAKFKRGDLSAIVSAWEGVATAAVRFDNLPMLPQPPGVAPPQTFQVVCVAFRFPGDSAEDCVQILGGEDEDADLEMAVDPQLETAFIKGEIEIGGIAFDLDVRAKANAATDVYQVADDPSQSGEEPEASFLLRRDAQVVVVDGWVLSRPGTQSGRVKAGPFGKISKRSGRARFFWSPSAFVCRYTDNDALFSCFRGF